MCRGADKRTEASGIARRSNITDHKEGWARAPSQSCEGRTHAPARLRSQKCPGGYRHTEGIESLLGERKTGLYQVENKEMH
ncbi:hypothetical protein CNYM01_13809 [Colletotrichum nymphaeae SA-01]|uniref:Uncharacterized protein n=1 Tax=Colletotrichum nymphaeae SA-01 TaxID=1460502 RepID=A0A135UD64_9PEZI|nr:hypothetical protein CNYM01_13809 [Colletotrichum nymphaeae SA-01]